MNIRLVLLVIFAYSSSAYSYDPIHSSIHVSLQGMQLQSERMKIISQNISNADTTAINSIQNPYRRKTLVVKNIYDPALKADIVRVAKIGRDISSFKMIFDPSHPASDEKGYVQYPNVDTNLEMVDAKEAQRSFEANMSAMEIARSNQAKLIEGLK